MSKRLFTIFFFLLALVAPVSVNAEGAEELAQFIVHLETGENWDQSLSPGEQTRFAEHSANMKRLRDEGTILFGARYGKYGLLIMQSESQSSANDILAADPGVEAGIFQFRIEPISVFYPWHSSKDK